MMMTLFVIFLLASSTGVAWKMLISTNPHQSAHFVRSNSCLDISPAMNEERTRFVARVSYDGTDFQGWQEQGHGLRTVQQTLSSSLKKRFGRIHSKQKNLQPHLPLLALDRIHVCGASRTDKGVHALGQAIHLDIPTEFVSTMYQQPTHTQCTLSGHVEVDSGVRNGLEHFQYVWNEMLPKDVRVFNLSTAPESKNGGYFHVTKEAQWKKYVYRFSLSQTMNPLERRYCVYFPHAALFDKSLFEHALNQFVGTYDFIAFGNKIERTRRLLPKLDTVRKIFSTKLIEEHPLCFRVEIVLKSALYKMVRNIVGTCTHVATGQMDVGKIKFLLNNGVSRCENVASVAPAEGLCLEKVHYDLWPG
jgi:tRNA pseudouridine38-40 synthase